MYFTDPEIATIVSLFNDDRNIDLLNRLAFVRSVYNERLRVTSHVTMNRLISILTNVFDRIIAEIRQYVPLNLWVRVFFNFPTREFSTSTLLVNQIEKSMFMDTLSRNIQSNDAIGNVMWLYIMYCMVVVVVWSEKRAQSSIGRTCVWLW